MWALTAKESFKNKQESKQKGNPQVFTGIPSQGKGSLEQSLKLLVEFSNKSAHGLASAPKYKGQGHTKAG